jgi:uncharacterized protein with HEPN domain
VPSEKPLRRLEEIPENIAHIEQFTAGMEFDGFAANSQAVYASLYALLIISEAARKLGAEAETLVPSQPWPEIRGIGSAASATCFAMNTTVSIPARCGGSSTAEIWRR